MRDLALFGWSCETRCLVLGIIDFEELSGLRPSFVSSVLNGNTLRWPSGCEGFSLGSVKDCSAKGLIIVSACFRYGGVTPWNRGQDFRGP